MPRGRIIIHGHAQRDKKSALYFIWVAMRQRCNNPNNKGWCRYGGRGIKVHPAWDSFEVFMKDMGPSPSPKHTIDRHPDKSGNYEPGNVRWATMKEQANNTRRNIIVDVLGEKMTLTQAVERYGKNIPYGTIKCRIHRGVPAEKALGIWSHCI